MSGQIQFGRRAASTFQPAPVFGAAPQSLSPEAEAFRAELAAERRQSGAGFDDWLHTQRTRRRVAWVLTFALLCPGVLCFVFNAPGYVSGGLEAVGVGVNIWLRIDRRRHLKEITNWDSEPTGSLPVQEPPKD